MHFKMINGILVVKPSISFLATYLAPGHINGMTNIIKKYCSMLLNDI